MRFFIYSSIDYSTVQYSRGREQAQTLVFLIPPRRKIHTDYRRGTYRGLEHRDVLQWVLQLRGPSMVDSLESHTASSNEDPHEQPQPMYVYRCMRGDKDDGNRPKRCGVLQYCSMPLSSRSLLLGTEVTVLSIR